MKTIVASMAACLALAVVAVAQDDGPSLGDVARQIRQKRAAAAAAAEVPTSPERVYTNQDIPKWTDDVTWKSSATAETSMPATNDPPGEHPVKVKRQDVECSFFFRAQDLLPAAKLDESGLKTLPAGEVARLAGTASIWGDKFDVSVHNDTGWQLREVTVRLFTGSEAPSGAGNSRPSAHTPDPPANDPAASGRLVSMQLNADPFSAAISTKELGAAITSGEKWSWEIVQARGIPPK